MTARTRGAIAIYVSVLHLGILGTSFAMAQNAPIAGSGQLPALNSLASAPPNVVEAISKMLGNRKQRNPFNHIKSCFDRAGSNKIGQIDCRTKFDLYFRTVLEERKDLLSGIPPLEVYARLAALSRDPSGPPFARDIYSLRGVITRLEDARSFREVALCFADAGPQPAIRQICRQRLDRFHTELMRENSVLFRDIDPALIRKRLLAVADRNNAVFGGSDTTAFDSLRNIRKAQQEERQADFQAMASARRYYCAPTQSRRIPPLETQMSTDGVCLCSYGRRYFGSNPTLRGRPVQSVYKSCGRFGRFRIVDLNRGRLKHGDWVTLQASHGGYMSHNKNGFVYADRQTPGKFEKFRLFRVSGAPGPIRPGEMVGLISQRGKYISTNLQGGGTLRGVDEKPEPHEYFVFVR